VRKNGKILAEFAMYNWNTNPQAFRSKEDKRAWELTHLLDYGIGNEKLDRKELETYWSRIKYTINPESRRLVEFLLWGRLYSLPTNTNFWNAQPTPVSF